ncbi:MAG TPA: DUF6252 family protein [Puia sp.]
MKTIKVLLLGGLSALLLFSSSSCTKSTAANTSAVLSDSSVVFTATIDGVNWQADSVSAVLDLAGNLNKFKLLSITGYSGTKRIVVQCADTSFVNSNDSTMSLATYTTDSLSGNGQFGYFIKTTTILQDTIWRPAGITTRGYTILSASDGVKKKVSGSFNFTTLYYAIDSTGIDTAGTKVNITNGVFKNIPYKYRGQKD